MSPNLRPNPFFGDITILESAGRSEYNSLQLKFEQRSVKGVSVLGAYTLAKSEDDASGFFPSAGDPNYPQDSQNLRGRVRAFQFRCAASLLGRLVWDMPSGDAQDGAAGLLLSDWQVSGVRDAAERPAVHRRAAAGNRQQQYGPRQSRLRLQRPAQRRRAIPPWPTRPQSAGSTRARSCSRPYGTFGNSGRNTVEGPGYQNVNLALMKRLPLGARSKLQLRLEAFNLFNHTNFNQPDNFLGSPTFGQILSAQSPRTISAGREGAV